MIGFPILAAGIALGAYWANHAWGRYWGWDPKETSALVTWLIYGIYLHMRGLRKWAGMRSAYILVIGLRRRDVHVLRREPLGFRAALLRRRLTPPLYLNEHRIRRGNGPRLGCRPFTPAISRCRYNRALARFRRQR